MEQKRWSEPAWLLQQAAKIPRVNVWFLGLAYLENVVVDNNFRRHSAQGIREQMDTKV